MADDPAPTPAPPAEDNKETLIAELQKKVADQDARLAQLAAAASELEQLKPRASKYQAAIQELVDAGKSKLPQHVQDAMEGQTLEQKFRMVQALSTMVPPPAPAASDNGQQPPAPQPDPPAAPPAPQADPSPPPAPTPPPPPKADALGDAYTREMEDLKKRGAWNPEAALNLAKRYRGK